MSSLRIALRIARDTLSMSRELHAGELIAVGEGARAALGAYDYLLARSPTAEGEPAD